MAESTPELTAPAALALIREAVAACRVATALRPSLALFVKDLDRDVQREVRDALIADGWVAEVSPGSSGPIHTLRLPGRALIDVYTDPLDDEPVIHACICGDAACTERGAA